MQNLIDKRGSGILLHITSLDSEYGIGDFGPTAHSFVDFLKKARQRYWQILPLSPTDPVFGNSPYSSFSAFAGNPVCMSPDLLVQQGWLKKKELIPKPPFPKSKVVYPKVMAYKERLLSRAYQNAKAQLDKDREYTQFCQQNCGWLDDFALFVVIKEQQSRKIWNQWPEELRDRDPKALSKIQQDFHDEITQIKLTQYLFFRQWNDLHRYCQNSGIEIIGDMPIYVGFDSVDVWTHPEIFKLNAGKEPEFVAGVPPDYFSQTGQRWGNPVYQWEELRKTNYQWWRQRIEHQLKLFDWIRIDHFRGFVAYWEIPAQERTAQKGYWMDGPGDDFFHALNKTFGQLPIIAEDLGVITPDVTALMKRFGFPGMKVLLFAFHGDIDQHPYIPKNYDANCVAYTGTHDNNTVLGWFEHEMTDDERKKLFEYFGRPIAKKDIHQELIKSLMQSKADTVIIPVQDILALGEKARMNKPATLHDNWQWRLPSGSLSSDLARKLSALVQETQRSRISKEKTLIR